MVAARPQGGPLLPARAQVRPMAVDPLSAAGRLQAAVARWVLAPAIALRSTPLSSDPIATVSRRQAVAREGRRSALLSPGWAWRDRSAV